MIYITGDCHSDFVRFNKENFPEQKEMTKDDCVIICGDFGGVWDVDEESKRETWWMNWLEERPFTTLFVDGNHENFDRLYDYPVEEWNGGKVHKIRPSVIHLMRGQVYQIEDKKKELDKGWLPYRINHISWWSQELPSKAEMEEGFKNLSIHGNTVDFIVSHCCSSSTQVLLGGGMFTPDVLTNYLEQIRQTVTFKKWFFGHYHENKNVSADEILLYEQIIRIS